MARVMDNMRLAFNVFATRDVALARRLLAEKATMRAAEFAAADSHFARLREGRPESIETSSIHLDVIRDLKRINGHLTSVAYPILEVAGELRDSRLRERRHELSRADAGHATSRVADRQTLTAAGSAPAPRRSCSAATTRGARSGSFRNDDRDRGARTARWSRATPRPSRSARPSSPRSRSSRRRARARRRSRPLFQ